MKICYLSDANSVHTRKWCEHFNKIGYETFVISLGDGEIPNSKVYSLGVKEFNNKSQINKLFTYITKIGRVRRIMEQENPDIIHAHYATSYGLLASLLNKHPYILSVWGSDVYDFPKGGFLNKKLLEHNLRAADYIFSTSEDMKIETENYTNKEIIVTPFGVDTDIFRPMEVSRKSKFTVGSVKSLYKLYGLDYLIRGYADFLKATGEIDSKLILAGRGPQESELKNLVEELNIQNHVEFLGFINTEGVVNAFNSMDVAVFPSIETESFGVAAVEAGACGVPMIVSEVGGLVESTRPGYSSMVIPSKDSAAITEKLVELYNNPDLRMRMGKYAREYVLDKFDINKNFSEVDRVYEKIYQLKLKK